MPATKPWADALEAVVKAVISGGDLDAPVAKLRAAMRADGVTTAAINQTVTKALAEGKVAKQKVNKLARAGITPEQAAERAQAKAEAREVAKAERKAELEAKRAARVEARKTLPPGTRIKQEPTNRKPAEMVGRRQAFIPFVAAVGASSIVDGKWLGEPENSPMIGMFYYRAPEPERFQVHKCRKITGGIATELIGKGIDRKAVYHRFYAKEVAAFKKALKAEAKAEAKKVPTGVKLVKTTKDKEPAAKSNVLQMNPAMAQAAAPPKRKAAAK